MQLSHFPIIKKILSWAAFVANQALMYTDVAKKIIWYWWYLWVVLPRLESIKKFFVCGPENLVQLTQVWSFKSSCWLVIFVAVPHFKPVFKPVLFRLRWRRESSGSCSPSCRRWSRTSATWRRSTTATDATSWVTYIHFTFSVFLFLRCPVWGSQWAPLLGLQHAANVCLQTLLLALRPLVEGLN